MMVKSGLEFFILKFTEPLQSYCCPVQKNLPRWAELVWQVSRYLWRGSGDFKKNLDHLSSSFFKLKNGDFKTRDFSPLIERVLAGVVYHTVEIALRQNTYSVYLGHFSSLLFANVRALDDLKTASNIESTTLSMTQLLTQCRTF